MNYSKLFIAGMTALMAISVFSCTKKDNQHGSTSSDTEESGNTSVPSHTQDEVEQYMNNLKNTSVANHLYIHYYRFNHSPSSYNKWDVWAWPYKPKAGEGYRFDWDGRTTSADRISATGDAKVDSFEFATADIDLTKEYDGGWNAKVGGGGTMGGTPTNFYTDSTKTKLDNKIGVQLVYSESRVSSSGFWKNDGGQVYLELSDLALTNKDSTTSYHVFFVQDKVQYYTALPPGADDITDPFAKDDGTNVTYKNSAYANADWTDKALQATSPAFLNGQGAGNVLPNGAGVGYQIMVSSFADSDGDGFGDIYGIEQKLDYLDNLGVNVLWLTPIQMSDSYHGYDISDYLSVDPKFGSKTSPAGVANHGEVTSDTAKADYKSLINAAHAKGMAVVMDLVINHTSTTNNWFISSAQLDKVTRGYYQWGNNKTQADDINEDKFWYPYGDHVYSYYAKFGSSMPELNYAYASTRAAVTSMALNWCEFGVDGFRMDAVKHIFLDEEVDRGTNDTVVLDVSFNEPSKKQQDYSSNLTKNLNLWREVNYTIKQAYPNAFFVGENFDGHAYHVAPYYEGFDSLFDFYSYFNLTSVASSAYQNGSTGSYTGWLASFLGAYDNTATEDKKYSAQKDPVKEEYYNSGEFAGKLKSKTGLTGNTGSIKYGGVWSLKGVLETNNKYRTGGESPNDTKGYSAINGAFTSNHDIARCINRIAGTEWSASGLEAQGEVNESNYETLDTLALLTEITELMLPGCTWIYYGDELGMTGNLQGKKATDGYADLAYRQPMKWAHGGAAGDGSMTCDYSITGAAASVAWDNMNASTKVKDAATQVEDENSHYNVLANFAKAKSTIPALIKGNFNVTAVEAGAATGQYGVVIDRTLGSSQYKFFVNFGNTDLTIYNQPLSSIKARSAILTDASGNVIASYGGSTASVAKYSLIIGGKTYDCQPNPTPSDPSFEEYMVFNVPCEVGDEVITRDNINDAEWVMATLDGASTGFVKEGGKIVCKTAGNYDFYLKFKYQQDQIYIGPHS